MAKEEILKELMALLELNQGEEETKRFLAQMGYGEKEACVLIEEAKKGYSSSSGLEKLKQMLKQIEQSGENEGQALGGEKEIGVQYAKVELKGLNDFIKRAGSMLGTGKNRKKKRRRIKNPPGRKPKRTRRRAGRRHGKAMGR